MNATFAIREGVPFVGARAFPWAAEVRVTNREDWHQRGFHLRFENGWMLSASFGTGTYCENRDRTFDGKPFIEEPEAAECWGWWAEDDDWPIEGGGVLGYQSVEDVLKLIDDMQTWPSPNARDDQTERTRGT